MRVHKLIPLSILGLIIVFKSFGSEITIKYIIQKDSARAGRDIDSSLLNIVPNNWDHIDQNSLRPIPSVKKLLFSGFSQEVIVVTYAIQRDGCYFLKELFGHELLLTSSSDTIVAYMTQISARRKVNGRSMPVLNDSVMSTWLWKLSFDPPHRYIGFFDSLAYIHGDIKANMNYTFKLLKNDVNDYWAVCNKVYRDRMRFLLDNSRAFNMPKHLRYYAFKEIEYGYYHDLMDPNIWNPKLIDSFPRLLTDSIKLLANNLNDADLFNHISYYRLDISDYICDFQAASLKISLSDSSYLLNRLQYCEKVCKDQSLAYILASLMEKTGRTTSNDIVQKIYAVYRPNTAPPGVTEYVDSLYNILVTNAISPDKVLNYVFQDSLHEIKSFKNLFTENIILIDCWATWCVPCREQMSSLDSIIAKYKNRIQFISLSADQSINKWDNWMKSSKSKNPVITQVYAINGFENIFFRTFRINAIPRYILVSKSGHILNLTMPYPANQKEFAAQLDQALSEHNLSVSGTQ